MSKQWTRCFALAAILSLAAGSASAGYFYGFERITANAPINVESQFRLEVVDAGSGNVTFKFTNSALISSSITGVYVDDVAIVDDPTKKEKDQVIIGYECLKILDGATLGYVNGTSSLDFSNDDKKKLPSENTATPPFTTDYAAEANSPDVPGHGVNESGDELSWTFKLSSGKSFLDLIGCLDDGTLRFGLHVQSINGGKSDSFVNGEQLSVVPTPAAAGLAFVGLAFAGWRRR